MSQSDYIKFRKTAQVLRETQKLPSVLEPENYTAFESYNLETTVQNTKESYSRLHQSGFQTIFDMEKKVSACPTFILCRNTHTRGNRVLHSPQIPAPISHKTGNNKVIVNNKKTYTPIMCQLKKGYVVRSVNCTKHQCKCRTRVLSAY